MRERERERKREIRTSKRDLVASSRHKTPLAPFAVYERTSPILSFFLLLLASLSPLLLLRRPQESAKGRIISAAAQKHRNDMNRLYNPRD